MNIEEALTLTGYGKFNIALIIVCGFCLYAVNSELYALGYILPTAQCDLDLGIKEKGALTSAGFVGIICSAYMCGYLSGTKGRNKVVSRSLFAAFFCTLASSFATSFWVFVLLRFLNGVFISAPSAAIFAYLGEFHNNKNRSRAIALASVFVALALIAVPVIAWALLSQSFSISLLGVIYKPWRLFLVACGLPALCVAIALTRFPESPKFLLLQGKKEEALEVLRRVYTINTGATRNFQILDLKEDNSAYDLSLWEQTAPLFRRPYCIYTIITCIIQFGVYAASSGLFLWYPNILQSMSEKLRINGDANITMCEAIDFTETFNSTTHCDLQMDNSVFRQNILIGIGYFIGYSCMGLIVNITGIRILIVACLFSSSVSGAALYFFTSPAIIDALFILFMVLSGISVSAVSAAVIDIFPTNLRTMAVCLSMMMGRIGSVTVSSIMGYMLQFSCVGTFFVLSIFLLGCAGLASIIPEKTSHPTPEKT